jgi:glycine/D-amino acid oxidase-like deaminating enzyme
MAGTVLPTPDFSYDPSARPFIAGERPYRSRSYRLEPETIGDKFVVHNYGHGGAGITMSWGCAHEVRDIITGHGFSERQPVAVLGSGVMGLTAAALLTEVGLAVKVYAKDFPPHTTSNVAGGQWAPSLVERASGTRETEKFDRILRRAFATHKSKIGQGYGVSPRLNYTLHRSDNFDRVPRDVIPEPTFFRHLPFSHLKSSGYAYSTLLVEPPIFLAKLKADLEAAEVEFVQREFIGAAAAAELTETIVVNCTGLGSRKIWPDRLLQPVKGQLVLLKPQAQLQYLYSSKGYLFPRADHVVVGGTEERGVDNDTPDPQMCAQIIRNVKAVFSGAAAELGLEAPLPAWFIQNK